MIGDIIGFVVGQVVELVIKAPGWVIVRAIKRHDRFEPDGFLTLIVGLAFWALIISTGILVYRHFVVPRLG